jgi:hypothetical protein
MTVKFCTKCNSIKDVSEFTIRRRNKSGLDSYCKQCNDIYRKQYRIRPESKIKINNRLYSYRRKNPQKHLILLAKRRSKLENIDFDLKDEDVIVPRYCPGLGIPILVAESYRTDNSISIDRIDPLLGYIKSNIIVISWRANRIKGTASMQEMQRVLDNFNKFDVTNLHSLSYNDRYIDELWRSAKKRAKRTKIAFDITRDDIKIPYVCPIFGMPLERGVKVRLPNSPSIDRIDNTKGYVKDNIRIISYRANTLKNNATYEEYKVIFEFYSNLIF